VKKLLAALSSVLTWGKRNGYLTNDPSDGITGAMRKVNHNDTTGRLPYSSDDLKLIFKTQRDTAANHWLPWLALYTGARLEELGQLRKADVRIEDGIS
jgi:integrase